MEISDKEDIVLMLGEFFLESSWYELFIKLCTRKSVHSFQTVFNSFEYMELWNARECLFRKRYSFIVEFYYFMF